MAEYVALSITSQESIWLGQLVSDVAHHALHIMLSIVIELKHIYIYIYYCILFAKEFIQRRSWLNIIRLMIWYIADKMTNGLPKYFFQKFQDLSNVCVDLKK